MSTLMSVEEAIAGILSRIGTVDTETISITEAVGRVLAEDVISDTNLPPFDNSAMDGFAIRAEDSGNNITLNVVMDIPAGVNPSETLEAGQAARIMTGAPIPQGANAVIPVEDTDADFSSLDDASLPEQVTLGRVVEQGAAIRRLGENIHEGQTILTAGTVITPAGIGMLASLGKAKLTVLRRPRVAIIGSGDELVDVDETPELGQIRDSNSYALSALIEQDGAIPLRQPIAPDDADAIREMFKNTLEQHPDLIVSSAGVSVGAADYIRAILDELGEIGFWKINLRPGKPLAFGEIATIPFFGLPGNPVSAMVTYLVLVRPALMTLAGKPHHPRMIRAKTAEAMRSDGRRTFARVTLTQDEGAWVASETGTQSSGAHLSMVLADGLLVIPEGVTAVDVGTELDVLLLNQSL